MLLISTYIQNYFYMHTIMKIKWLENLTIFLSLLFSTAALERAMKIFNCCRRLRKKKDAKSENKDEVSRVFLNSKILFKSSLKKSI